ncbi:aromatic-ring hydroxylase C-terminal domain-containing protein [Nocardia niigatensis]
MDHPLESGVERLRHHLRRPTHRRTEITQSTRVTPFSGQTHADRWAVPGLGDIPAPAAVLIRPDGHVAWARNESCETGLSTALTAWTGPAA